MQFTLILLLVDHQGFTIGIEDKPRFCDEGSLKDVHQNLNLLLDDKAHELMNQNNKVMPGALKH
jgi:hypothetical protein